MQRVTVGVVGVLCAIGLAACGGGDGDEGADSGATIAVAADNDFAFDPSAWTVPAGDVTVDFTNDGQLQHSIAVVPAGQTVDSIDDYDATASLLFVELDGETSGSDTATLDAGTYQVICTIPGHLDGGMVGELTVTES